jgi:GTPase SAR1 family protein
MSISFKDSLCFKTEPNKIFVMGDRDTGKSTFIRILTENLQPKSNSSKSILSPYTTTKLEKGKKLNSIGIVSTPIKFDKFTITIKDLTDTPCWKFTKIFNDEIEEVKGVLIFFSADNIKSYEYSKVLLEYIFQTKRDSFLNISLIMNKSDLLFESGINNYEILNSQEVPEYIDKSKYVNKDNVFQYLNGFPNVNFYEISCVKNTGIKEIETLIKNFDLDCNNDEDISMSKKNESRNNSRDTSCILF